VSRITPSYGATMPRFILHEDRKPRVEFIFILWVRDVNAYYEELNERAQGLKSHPLHSHTVFESSVF